MATVGRRKRRKASAVHHLIKKVAAGDMIDSAVARATCQPVVKNLPGMTRSADKFLSDRTGMLQEEFFQRVGERLEGIVNLLLGDIEEKHDKIPAQNLAYTLSVVMDKAALIAGRPQALTAQLNFGLGVDGLSREEVVAALTGRRVKEVEVKEAEPEEAELVK